jgi:hypothetical protein
MAPYNLSCSGNVFGRCRLLPKWGLSVPRPGSILGSGCTRSNLSDALFETRNPQSAQPKGYLGPVATALVLHHPSNIQVASG